MQERNSNKQRSLNEGSLKLEFKYSLNDHLTNVIFREIKYMTLKGLFNPKKI